jgi:hypothetical protein
MNPKIGLDASRLHQAGHILRVIPNQCLERWQAWLDEQERSLLLAVLIYRFSTINFSIISRMCLNRRGSITPWRDFG